MKIKYQPELKEYTMSTLFSAANANSTRTANGMKTLASSESSLVDLFFKWGGVRGKFKEIQNIIAGAIGTDKDLAVRTLLWGRDVREGAGERQLFKDAIDFISKEEILTIEEARRIMNKIPELGRFDDLFIFVGTVLEEEAFELIKSYLDAGNGLAHKWTPRKGPIANAFRKFLGLSPKDYRKMLVAGTNVVETAMCSKEWNGIDFSKLPSVASARYQKAFAKHSPEAYASWKAALVREDGTAKVNAGAVYPYDIIKSLRNGDKTVADAQWKALPDFMAGSESRGILPVIDTSGSMTALVPGQKAGGISMLDVAESIGLYVSERNRGIFKGEFITFSSRPTFHKITGKTLTQRYNSIDRSGWEMSTNLHAVFELILNSAVKASVSPADMPGTILIVSDMQFNQCTRWDDSAMQMITRKYKEAGYEAPHVVWWNVNTSSGVPVKYDTNGTALVSGFSPSIMKAVLKAEDMNPLAVMKTTVMNPRYDW